MAHGVLDIDGSQGEGGGQILRSSLALSLITGKPFRLHHIRARRPKPGLHAQHLMSVRSAATVGKATVLGDSLHSSELSFTPGRVTPGKYTFSIGTAGATGLVLHTLYLPLALCATEPSEITITGGTHVSTSPCFHFLYVTWRRYLELLGLKVSVRMVRPGFYPRGGGTIVANVQPARPHGISLSDHGKVTAAHGFSAVAGLPEDIARRQARRATTRLKSAGLKVHIIEESWDDGPGTVLSVSLNTQPVPTLFYGLGARGKRAEAVADEAVDQAEDFLTKSKGRGVDAHSADQLVLPLALADGPSTLAVAEVTQHLLTNLDVIRLFLEREILCEGELGEPGLVRIL
jgi:RNA 3'-terminal phosphate cyclase (ATP)